MPGPAACGIWENTRGGAAQGNPRGSPKVGTVRQGRTGHGDIPKRGHLCSADAGS